MKKFKLLVFVTALFGIQSCSETDQQSAVEHRLSLAGQVYGRTNSPLDSASCGQSQPANNALPKLLFVDDSTFIKVLPATCGDLGNCTRYYMGKYKTDDLSLLLSFGKLMLVYHPKSRNLQSPFSEIEKSDFFTERLLQRSCNNKLFFEECATQGSLMTLKTDTLANDLNYLEKQTILSQLSGQLTSAR